tara:strand:+ start:1114 stop:1899 length:786 start_codon:yes stop_codon:yes gene_type:complete
VLTNNTSLEYTPALGQITERVGNVRTSLGQGLMGNLSLGYSFTSQFSTELGVSYLNGKSSQGSYTLKYTNSEEISTYTYTGHLFSIDPTFVFSSKEREFFRTYVSLGFPINFISFDEHYVGEEPNSTKTAERLTKYTGAIKIGVSTKFGILAKLSESLETFGEIGFTYINFSPNESETTIYNLEGDNSLSTLNNSELKSVYKETTIKDFDYDSANSVWVENYSTNSPRVRQKFDIPVSYLSFSLGIKINIFKNGNKNDRFG